MANESVWFEQVDRALIKHLKELIKLPNEAGKIVSVPVSVRKPEEDFKVEVYPSITIYAIQATPDIVRYFPDKVKTSEPSGNVITMEDSAKPFTLHYQIDFWSKYQTHMNTMTELWLSSFWRDFNLPVIDMAGNSRDCYVYSDHRITKSDLLEDSKRIFHSILTLRVWVELDNRKPEEVFIVNNFDLGLL